MSGRPLSLRVAVESFPIAGSFTISRGSRTEAIVVVARVGDGSVVGHGECVPYARYGETVEAVVAAIEAMAPALAAGAIDRVTLAEAMPAGAARNAVDCALWDYEAKRSGVPAHVAAGLPAPKPLVTAYTLSLGTPESMAAAAAKAAHRPLLKVKLGGDGDVARIRAVRAAAPNAALVVDANEAWRPENFAANAAACAEAGVELVEQPFPAGDDAALAVLTRPLPICADESMHGRVDLAALAQRYDAVNIKLDKAGGLTEALAIVAAAEAAGLKIMLGCMVGTSLAMAPAILAAQRADWVDLDGPLLLARDREPGLVYEGSTVFPPTAALWG